MFSSEPAKPEFKVDHAVIGGHRLGSWKGCTKRALAVNGNLRRQSQYDGDDVPSLCPPCMALVGGSMGWPHLRNDQWLTEKVT